MLLVEALVANGWTFSCLSSMAAVAAIGGHCGGLGFIAKFMGCPHERHERRWDRDRTKQCKHICSMRALWLLVDVMVACHRWSNASCVKASLGPLSICVWIPALQKQVQRKTARHVDSLCMGLCVFATIASEGTVSKSYTWLQWKER